MGGVTQRETGTRGSTTGERKGADKEGTELRDFNRTIGGVRQQPRGERKGVNERWRYYSLSRTIKWCRSVIQKPPRD